MNTSIPWRSITVKLRGLTLVLLTTLVTLVPSVSVAADAKASKYYEDALVRYEKKDLVGAIIRLKNALQTDRNMLPVQMLLGKALLQNGDVVAAEVALTEALRLGVNRAEVPIRIRSRQFAEANVATDRALALTPNSAEAWYQKDSVAHVSGDLAATLAAYDRTIKLEAGHVEARMAPMSHAPFICRRCCECEQCNFKLVADQRLQLKFWRNF